ncbi:HORMA domain-containing protein [Lipomyces kononenkoae]
MAQLFRTDQGLLQKSSTSQDIMTTPRQSQELVQTFISAAFGCITFLRGLFSDDNYIEERFIGGSATTPLNPRDYVRLKKLKRGLSDQADLFLDWIERGIFDALEHKYLKAVLFGIYLDPRHPTDVAETYTFNVAYRDDNDAPDLEITDDRGEKIRVGVTYDDARKTLQQMMRRFITLTQTLPPLPDDRYLTIRLLFDESCPADYQPPGFKDATDDSELQFSLEDGEQIDRQDAGTLNAGWHAVSLKIASLPEREEYTQLLSQPQVLSSQISTTPKPRKKVRIENAMTDVEEPKWMAATVKTRAMALAQDHHRDRLSQASQTSQGQTRHALQQMFDTEMQAETDTQTLLSSQQVQIPSPPPPTAAAATAAAVTASAPVAVEKPQPVKSPSKKPQKSAKSSQKSTPVPRKPPQSKSQPPPSSRNPTSVTDGVEKLSLSTQSSSPTKKSARRDILGSHNSFLDENDQSSAHVACECAHSHDNFDLVQCNKCNSWKHIYCYGYSHVRDPALSDQFLCYSCRFARLSSETTDKLRRLALFRCALKILYDTRRQFASGPWKPDYLTAFANELVCTVVEVRPILRLLRREGVLIVHGSNTAHRARKHSAAAIPSLVKTVAIKNAMKGIYFDPAENVLVVAERLNATMESLGDEDQALIPSDTEDGPDVAMADDNDGKDDNNVSEDEPSLPLPPSPPKKTASRPRGRPPKSATKQPKISSKISSPRSSSSAASTPDVTTTTIETTFTEPEITPDRTDLASKLVSTPETCPIPILPSEPMITGPRVDTTDYVPRKRKISVVEEPLNPKY